MVSAPDSTPPGWQGIAHLTYQVRAGKTTPLSPYTRAPLKLQKPLYPESGGLCHTTLVHTAGGMVAGDELKISAHLQPDSRVLITTAAASKIYGQPQAGPQAPTTTQKVTLDLAPATCLEWFPQETIVFNGAHYHQTLRVDLAADALWMGWDITRFGRSARGETFQQGHWQSTAEVWQQNRPLWIDRQFLVGGSPGLDTLNGLAGYPVIATLALLGKQPAPELIQTLRQLWPPEHPGDTGITRLQLGLICRYRGPSTQVARQWFTALWQVLRPWYLGQPACNLRVWGM